MEILRGRQLRPVSLGIDHAQEAKRLTFVRLELVPGQGRHVYQVMLREVVDAIRSSPVKPGPGGEQSTPLDPVVVDKAECMAPSAAAPAK